MGYSITIGERVFVPPCEAYPDDVGFWRVDHQTHPKAPVCPSTNGNWRSPSYTSWASFAKREGLHDFFFAPGHGLLWSRTGYDDAGCRDLTEDHAVFLEQKLRQRQRRGPRWVGSGEPSCIHDYDYDRLAWLTWWVRWAVDNCKNPTFYS